MLPVILVSCRVLLLRARLFFIDIVYGVAWQWTLGSPRCRGTFFTLQTLSTSVRLRGEGYEDCFEGGRCPFFSAVKVISSVTGVNLACGGVYMMYVN